VNRSSLTLQTMIAFEHVMFALTYRHIAAGALAMAMLVGACAVEDEVNSPQPGLETSSTTVISAVTSVSFVAPTEPTTMTSDDLSEVESSVDDPLEVASTVDVELADYAISVEGDSVPAGVVTLSVLNQDRAPHDVVLVATDLPADRLPTNGIRVDERSLEIEIRARTPSLQPGTTGSLTAKLTPGLYTLVCTVPHHYAREMMVAALIVT